MTPAIVLASGGLDSTAALIWAISEFTQVVALTLRYGQNAAETSALRSVCAELRAPLIERSFGAVLPPIEGNWLIPGRNLIMLSLGAAEGGRLWPGLPFALVTGWSALDGDYPDCSEAFRRLAADACSAAIGASVDIRAPWIGTRKDEIVSWATERGYRQLLERSVSCYHGTGCLTCKACKERAQAI
jgi:7-cyano-7-deazaguanine synthase